MLTLLEVKRRVPGPASSPLGHLRFYTDPLAHLTHLQRKYGDIVAFRFFSLNAHLVSDPELIREILVTQHANFVKSPALQRARMFLGDGLLTNEGASHLRQRRLVAPAFYHDRLRSYGTMMIDLAGLRLREWQDNHLEQAPFDMHREMVLLTQAIVARTLYSADVSAASEPLAQSMTTLFDLFRYLRLPWGQHVSKLPHIGRKFTIAKNQLDRLIYALIAERRASHQDRGDLLSMLLMATGESPADSMDDRQVRDEMLTLFLAGHETTANALTWTWKLLAENPDAESKFHDELRDVLSGRLPEFEDIENLPYTRAVFSESMRLFPPAWILGRMAKHAFRLGSYELDANAVVLMSQWVVHRHPKYWPYPDRFMPERWFTHDDRPKLAYFPFGVGPRVCIGERFAWMEGVLVLAALGQHWRFRTAKGARLGLAPSVTLRPRYGMNMTAEQIAG